jgi:hypothetical protein
MKHRITIAALATTAALGGTCAFLVPAASASPSAAKAHTLTVTSVQVSAVNYSQTVINVEDKDLNKAGRVVGYDLLHVVINPKKGTAAVNVVFEASGGFVYGLVAGSNSGVMHGTVTGGTGAFKGATGTILAKNLNRAGTRTAVTITYRT